MTVICEKTLFDALERTRGERVEAAAPTQG